MNILTFDIEDWFHILECKSTKNESNWDNFESRILNNAELILESLKNKNQKATFFCLGWVARKYPELLRKIDLYGHEVGTHSDLHKLVYEQSKKEFKIDLKRSIDSIENVIGKKVVSYRAPGFSLINSCKWVFEILLDEGIEFDCSIFPANRSHGGFEKFPSKEPCILEFEGKSIKEFPINVVNFMGKSIVFSGGGYFRFFPYKYISYLTKKSNYIMTYFHPRDFDPNQPLIKGLNLIKNFKSYYGIKQAFPKYQKFIKEFTFYDLKNANRIIDWEKASKIKIESLK